MKKWKNGNNFTGLIAYAVNSISDSLYLQLACNFARVVAVVCGIAWMKRWRENSEMKATMYGREHLPRMQNELIERQNASLSRKKENLNYDYMASFSLHFFNHPTRITEFCNILCIYFVHAFFLAWQIKSNL